MIDLHLHTTASDGRLMPAELVARASQARLTTISVTDHDTVAAFTDVTAAARSANIRVVPGIEITSIDEGRDVHVLGYFFDPASATLGTFLEGQRALRVARVREIGIRLSTLGMPIDVDAVLQAAANRPGSSVGRPQLARALVAAGYVESVQVAFDQWLATGQPAFVRRTGPSPATVISVIHEAGGVASFAHPGVTKRDALIPALVERGLDAIEVYHSDHAPEDERTYLFLATRLGVLISGGSDFHGDPFDSPKRPFDSRAAPRARALAQGRPHTAQRSRRGVAAGAGLRGTRGQGRAEKAGLVTGLSPPLIDVRGMVKDYQGLRPLRMQALTLAPGDVVAIDGLDAIAAEMFVHLITGATLPDSGDVSVFGRNTRSITDGDAWLKSLDQVGMITARGILIDAFTVLQNVAMALTLDVDPIDSHVLPEAGALAREVGLDPAGFDLPTGRTAGDIKMRVHLARALALGPKVLIAEHPSATLPRESVAVFAADLAKVARSRGLGLLALTSDDAFARGLGGRRLVLNGGTGDLKPVGILKKLFG